MKNPSKWLTLACNVIIFLTIFIMFTTAALLIVLYTY